VNPWRGLAARCLHRLGDVDAARELAAQDLVVARRWGTPRRVGSALRVAGIVGPPDHAIPTLRDSVRILAPSAARLEYLYSLCELGSALRRSSQRVEARSLLAEVADGAGRLGAKVLAERAHEELRIAGAKPRRSAVTGPASLTASERRVAEMAVGGQTNSEIAQALFVTKATVETHLTHVYRKLGIGRREELLDVLSPPHLLHDARWSAGSNGAHTVAPLL
jgi:DNA-binding CsgD family transcriptional regulator